MPPTYVVQASRTGPLFENVSIQEVQGAPEFRWFDGGAVLTTRPTRTQALKVLSDDLERTHMLAPSRVQSDYMLYVKFEDLHGPDVILFTDKHASAVITFRLVNWRTGAVVKSDRLVAQYDADFGGIAPEQVRNLFFGPIGVARDNPDQTLGGLALLAIAPKAFLGDYLFFRYRVFDQEEIRQESKSTPLATNIQAGPINGTKRRLQAWHGLLNLAFDEFMSDTSKDGSIIYKRAVGCTDLNPYGVRVAEILETADVYAVDCPGSKYMESLSRRVYLNRF